MRAKHAPYGLLAGALGVALLALLTSGCQAVSRNSLKAPASLWQSEEPAPPQSLDEWMGLKRMDP